jgi:hypothetical protein
MKEDLIAVALYPNEMERLSTHGHTHVLGISAIDPEWGLGRSTLNKKWLPLFCSEEDRKNFPDVYCTRAAEYGEDDNLNDEENGELIYSISGHRLLYEVYRLRYVPGYWTVSNGTYLEIFADKNRCLAWLLRQDYRYLVVRDHEGNEKKIKPTIELV